jgi:beta-galactosidase
MIRRGAELDAWRAPLANETDGWNFRSSNTRHTTDGYGRFAATEWYSAGLDRLQVKVESFNYDVIDNENVVINTRSVVTLGTGRGAFLNRYRYTISGSGELTIDHTVIPNGDMPAWLPSIGLEWILDRTLGDVEWYGRGPQENYPDRKSGYRVGIYKSTVKEMYEPYLIPQDYGLRTDTRRVRITDPEGTGLEFSGDKLFNFSVHPFSKDNLTRALYTYQLKSFDGITFNMDYATSGVGCTALSVFPEYQVMPGRFDFRTKVTPIFNK